MSDETTPKIEQDYHYQVDQQVSINGFFDVEINGETARFQITNRYGATPEKIVKTVKAAIDAFTLLRQEFPRNLVVAKPQEVRQPIDDSGNELPTVNTFTATRMTVDMHNGKLSFKACGGQFEKFGVAIYEEVMKAAGLSYDPTKPENIPNIAGWRVDWIEYTAGNGKQYKKVTRLLPGKSDF